MYISATQNPTSISCRLTSTGIWTSCDYGKEIKSNNIKKYIINKGATIIFWDDGDKTVSKRQQEDEFDKELGFLFAYFYKKYKGSNASKKRVIKCIDYEHIKTFLFEFYVNDTEKTPEQARSFLKNLKVDK